MSTFLAQDKYRSRFTIRLKYFAWIILQGATTSYHLNEARARCLELMGRNDGRGHNGNDDGDDDNDDHRRMQMMMAQCAHLLGAVHARCGKYDEARRWYEESLRKQCKVLGNIDDNGGEGAGEDGDNNAADETMSSSPILRRYHYELGKTYNSLAALEAMGEGEAGWDGGNYVYGDRAKPSRSSAAEPTLAALCLCAIIRYLL